MSISPRPDQSDAGDEIDVLALFGTIWAGKFWIITSVLLGLLAGMFFVLRATPVYQADSLIQLETRSGSLALPDGLQALLGEDVGSRAPVETEIEILRSRMVVGEAVQALELQTIAHPLPLPILGKLPARLGLEDPGFLPEREWGNERVRVDVLDVPERWLGENMLLRITAPDRFSMVLPDGSNIEGTVRQPTTFNETGRIIVGLLEGPVGREFIVRRAPIGAAIRTVQANFTAAAASRGASMLRLSYRDTDPRHAEQILDAIMRAYVAQNIARSAAEAESSLRFIEEQLPQARAAVEAAQQTLNDYRQQRGSVDVDYETRSLLERATAIEAQLSALVLQEEDLRKRYTTSHPTYQLLLESRRLLEEELAGIRQETTGLPETQQEVFNLTRNLTVAEQVYTQLLNRSQELQVLRASTVGSVRVIDQAYSDGGAISPRTSRTLALSVILGGLVGVGQVLLRRALRQGVRSAEQIERTGLPIFGTISLSPDAVRAKRGKGPIPIHTLQKPDDLVAEAMRSLRTSLHFGMIDAKTKSVLLTSAAPEAGKSFTAVNLAVVSAQAGQKICLIDADLRRGHLRRYLGKDRNTPGLSEYLAGNRSIDEVLVDGPVEGLSVILTGHYPPNPSELLMRPAFQTLLEELNQRFDLVIIDGPPALAVTDPVIIGRYVGTSIVVVRHMETLPKEIEAVRHMFETAGARISGAVLNGYRQEEGRGYAAGNYGYRYAYKTRGG